MNNMIRKFTFFLAGVVVLNVHGAFAQENSICYECHSDTELVTFTEDDEEVSLYVDDHVYSSSAHRDFYCIDCHSDLDESAEYGHDTPLEKVDCAICHSDVSEIYDTSIHGQLLTLGDSEVPVCTDCHGTHNIFTATDSRSTVNKFNLMFTCAECHQNSDLIMQRGFGQPEAVPQFFESVHAQGLLQDGLIVAPSCNDCHGVHDIQTSSNPISPIYKRNVYKTCGTCHTRVEDVYTQSVHGQLVESGDRRGPVCTDCHESHQIISPSSTAFKQYSDQKCGECHGDMLERYHETFHGKAMELGATNVASCYDCHGYHNVFRTDDIRSLIHDENRVATCGKCHEGANTQFANYITHANHYDKENHPELYYAFVFMTILFLGVFLLFGSHTLLWVARSVALFLRDSKTFREAKLKVLKDDLVFQRFSPVERFLHVMIILSFTTLVITGMPLKFHDAGWALYIMNLVGGVDNAGYMHRTAAIIMTIVFLMHAYILMKNFIPRIKTFKDEKTGRYSFKKYIEYMFRPDSLIPHKRDLVDFWNHQKWFFGKGKKPHFERWTYWEKFDYFAVFWGVLIIGFSGLILWFPVFFTLFLPGWAINVAQIIHSDEALLAAGFIFTFHFFNVHFRIEKFPMDTVIFSGRISKQEFKEERSGWLERLEKEGSLESLRTGDEWEEWKPIAKTFGFIAFGTGLVLAVAIFTAMLVRLLFS